LASFGLAVRAIDDLTELSSLAAVAGESAPEPDSRLGPIRAGAGLDQGLDEQGGVRVQTFTEECLHLFFRYDSVDVERRLELARPSAGGLARSCVVGRQSLSRRSLRVLCGNRPDQVQVTIPGMKHMDSHHGS
jgi:hypothetical protein